MADLATVAELRDFLRMPELPESAARSALAGVSALVRDYTGRAFAATVGEVTYLAGSGSYSMLLPRLPVAGVTELLEAAGSSTERELVAGTNFEWDEDGLLRRIDGSVFVPRLRHYRVTYDHGTDVPDDVRLLVLRICARGVVNPEGLAQENAAGYGSTFGFDATRFAALSDPDKDALTFHRVTV